MPLSNNPSLQSRLSLSSYKKHTFVAPASSAFCINSYILSIIIDIDASDLTNVLVPIASNGDDQLIFKYIKQCIYAVGKNYNMVNKMKIVFYITGKLINIWF
jgi:hypothetical protein